MLAKLLASLEPGGPESSATGLARRAREQGVHVLLFEAAADSAMRDDRLRDARDLLRDEVRTEAMTDLLREEDLKATLARFGREGIPSLVIKGGVLALTHYEASYHRPRTDTDLFVPEGEAPRAERVLGALGYRRFGSNSGRLISYESTWCREGPGGRLQIDLHWRVSNVQGFARSFSFEEVEDSARPLPALGPSARRPSDVDALFVGAMHLIGNDRYGEGHKLIHLLDLQRIGGGLGESEWGQVAETAHEKRLCTVLAEALRRSEGAFGPFAPAGLAAELGGGTASAEPTASYVNASPRRAVLADFAALPGWRDRLRLLWEHVFPPADYLRGKFASGRRVSVLRLHARRILERRSP